VGPVFLQCQVGAQKGSGLVNKKVVIDPEKLSKKYKFNVSKVIRAWKKGLSDLEISTDLGINFLMLKQLRFEVESEHMRARYLRWLEKLQFP
jgi:hypothetical protein